LKVFFNTAIALFFLLHLPVSAQQGKQGINTNKPLDALSMDKWSSENGLISNNLTSIFQASSNFLWITTFNGIQRFDGVSFKLFDKSIIPSLSSNGFYKTFEDSKGNLWFCSQSSGIVKYASNVFEQVLPEGENSLSVRSIAEGPDGKIWIGTNNEGLFVYENELLSKVTLDDFENLNIMDLLVDDDGALFWQPSAMDYSNMPMEI
jgi:ligand-binding sensor domain-containing protein